MKRLACISVIGLFILCSSLRYQCLPIQREGHQTQIREFFPAGPQNSIVAEQWCKEVEKRTKGRVKVLVFSGGHSVSADQAYEAAVGGIVDIALFVPQYTAGRFPLTEVIQLPMGVKNALQGTKMINAWYQKVQAQGIRRRENHLAGYCRSGGFPDQETAWLDKRSEGLEDKGAGRYGQDCQRHGSRTRFSAADRSLRWAAERRHRWRQYDP